jgi:hypothetical protein
MEGSGPGKDGPPPISTCSTSRISPALGHCARAVHLLPVDASDFAAPPCSRSGLMKFTCFASTETLTTRFAASPGDFSRSRVANWRLTRGSFASFSQKRKSLINDAPAKMRFIILPTKDRKCDELMTDLAALQGDRLEGCEWPIRRPTSMAAEGDAPSPEEAASAFERVSLSCGPRRRPTFAIFWTQSPTSRSWQNEPTRRPLGMGVRPSTRIVRALSR